MRFYTEPVHYGHEKNKVLENVQMRQQSIEENYQIQKILKI